MCNDEQDDVFKIPGLPIRFRVIGRKPRKNAKFDVFRNAYNSYKLFNDMIEVHVKQFAEESGSTELEFLEHLAI